MSRNFDCTKLIIKQPPTNHRPVLNNPVNLILNKSAQELRLDKLMQSSESALRLSLLCETQKVVKPNPNNSLLDIAMNSALKEVEEKRAKKGIKKKNIREQLFILPDKVEQYIKNPVKTQKFSYIPHFPVDLEYSGLCPGAAIHLSREQFSELYKLIQMIEQERPKISDRKEKCELTYKWETKGIILLDQLLEDKNIVKGIINLCEGNIFSYTTRLETDIIKNPRVEELC